ncbi:hypothetical protein Bhyg_01337 [Pseudolycoriella hygida]|uniref:C2H2-type domain-containing protein n=1 Tax=Pseudolycoriella hygida TaxID=35572 RepID=A0A9Q0N979_9DIPT|nr:hypothetical protein Bhyg_01337 [Pseudolycoriella hygida]
MKVCFLVKLNEAPQGVTTIKHIRGILFEEENVRKTSTTSKKDQTESINYVCYHCIYKSQSPTIIYKHWKENHKFPKITTRNIEFPSRPFMFRTIKIFQCCYCRRCSHYRDLKVHCQRTHPKQTFAMIDKLNPDKCAFCLHEFSSSNTNAIEHFNEFHKNLATDNLTEPNNYFNNELIEQITAVLPRDQVKCTHTNCNIIFFSKAELLAHTTEKHPGSDMQFVSIPNDPIMYGCINCAETSASETEMVTHIRKHLLQYQCKFCEKRFSHLEMIKVHHEIMHASKDVTYRNIDINENLDKYLAMKIIFPNGLVFTKGSAKYTKYGQMDGNIKLIAELDAKELEAAKKRQAEIETEPLLMPLKISKKSLKRGRISDSSDSDGSPHKAKRVTTHKKRAKSFRAKSPKPAVESSSSNSDDNLPLKSLIPFSYYGRNKEQVDLSKIFIEMPFGSSTVRVSCERFSLLFNINPKLCIKRCTD